MKVEKTLRPGEVRCVAKSTGSGKMKVWGVYDRARGSWPGEVPGFGKVKDTGLTEAQAQAEADRLNEFYAR